MSTGTGRRVAGAIAGVAIVGAGLLAPLGGVANAAKKPNPCKLLKVSEIATATGAEVGKPAPGLSTAVSRGCAWEVSANAEFPDGEIDVTVMTTGAKISFDTNKQIAGNQPVAGIKKSYYDPRTSALVSLKGDVLVTVQVLFISSDLPIHNIDRLDVATALAKKALKRA